MILYVYFAKAIASRSLKTDKLETAWYILMYFVFVNKLPNS